MKKIYFIRAKKNPYGGAENYLERLTEQLFKKNIDFKIINSFLPKFLPSWMRVFLFNLQLRVFKGSKFYFSLERISSSDIYRAGDGVHKAFLNIEMKSRFNPLHPLYLALEKKCFRNSKKIIANSYMVKREIQQIYKISPNKISVVYNGFNPKKIDQTKVQKIYKENNININEIILLFVGSGFKRKGVENFLKIISKLKDLSFKAFVVGSDSNIKKYKNLASDLLIDKKVIFTGPREDVDNFYFLSDILIFPTHYEPFGNVVLEAMSYGNAVFTTRQNGASEIMLPDYVMNNPDDAFVVGRIRELLNNPQLLDIIKLKNIEISNEFTVEKNVSETLKVISEVIN